MQHITRQINSFFEGLVLNHDTHTYTVPGRKNPLPSVSGLIKEFTIPFDAKAVSERIAGKGRGAELRKSWKAIADEACDRGNRVHDFGERYMFDRSLIPSCPQEKAVKKFWDELPEFIVPIMPELQMYHKQFFFAGTADILLYDKRTDSIVIADYKTNKDLFKNYKEKTLVGPFTHLLDSPFNKYQLQFSYYQLLLEQTGLRVSSRKLIWLERNGNYKMFDTEDFTHELYNTLKIAA